MIKATITVQINLRLNVAFAQIKFLKAQVAELEKNSSRDFAGNENEWSSFKWLFDRVPDGDDDEVS